MGFVRLVRTCSLALGIFAALLVGAAVAVVCQMVIWRYALAASTTWQTEFVTFAVLAATFLGSPYVLQIGGQVNVDLLPQALGRGGRILLGWIADLLGFATCAVFLWYAGWYWWQAFSEGWTTPTVWALPLWIPLSSMVLGFLFLVCEYLARFVEYALGAREPFQPVGEQR